jgi:hypothetical protein
MTLLVFGRLTVESILGELFAVYSTFSMFVQSKRNDNRSVCDRDDIVDRVFLFGALALSALFAVVYDMALWRVVFFSEQAAMQAQH